MLSPSPFNTSPDSPGVFVSHGEGPYANTRRALESIDLSPASGKRVLLKPNIGRVAAPESGVITHPQVIAAAIDAFREAGAEVAIGESPIVGVKMPEAYEKARLTEVASERDCPLLDMDARKFVDVPLPEGRAIQSLRVCPDVLEHDLVVSIPVMKMHMHTGVTLAVKNMKGCLWRRSKVALHMLPPVDGYDGKSINVAIADMSWALRPHLSIVDGTVNMQGLGPSAGTPRPLDVVLVGADAFSADAVACRLMGTRAEDIPHLQLASDRGYGVIDMAKISVAPDQWRDWSESFERPPENLTIEFPNIQVLDNNSCSACQSTLLLFLKRHAEHLLDYFPDRDEVEIAIGKGHTELPEGTLCLGNCTLRHRDRGTFVKGCPPVGSEILTAISGHATEHCEDGDQPPEG